MSKRLRGVQGGTSASKTVSILLDLINLAQSDKEPTLTSVTSESLPHLKKGALRDFLSVMQSHGYFREDRFNRTDLVYTFETGSRMEFFSSDQPSKVRGPRRDRLFVNEANNVPKETFDQLEIRTKDFVFADWNPVSEFWWHTDVAGRDDAETIILTYRDNEALDPRIVATIERRKSNASWWRVYGEGQIGEAEGRIYRDWRVIDEVPHEARLIRYGLDFGYTNDPTAIVALYRLDGGFIVDEVCYRRGMSNRQIADVLKAVPQELTMCDSAEPKSIDELRSYGLQAMPVSKGQGSVNAGIQYVQDQRISITKRSVDTLKEYRNYLWATDRDGRALNAPSGEDHALDAIRYAFDPDIGESKSVDGMEGFIMRNRLNRLNRASYR